MPSLGLNAAFGLVTNLLGIRADPYHGFNFLVEIEGILAGGFSECSGLNVETEVFDYREGGLNDYVHHFAGPTKYTPLVLKHGITQIDGLWSWHQDVVSGLIERRNGTVYLLDKQHLPVMWWDFADAFPIKWTGPTFNAANSAVAVESVELRHRGLSRPSLGNIIAGIGAAASASLDVSFGL